MRKEKILEILENAKDGNGAVPMRLVRTAFDKLPEPCEDTISRQAAIDAVDAIGHIATMPDGDKCIRRSAVKYTLSMLPPAQPEPHEGHWIEGKIYRDVIECNCSECGQLMTTAATVRMNFCPNCGAKMTEDGT